MNLSTFGTQIRTFLEGGAPYNTILYKLINLQTTELTRTKLEVIEVFDIIEIEIF